MHFTPQPAVSQLCICRPVINEHKSSHVVKLELCMPFKNVDTQAPQKYTVVHIQLLTAHYSLYVASVPGLPRSVRV